MTSLRNAPVPRALARRSLPGKIRASRCRERIVPPLGLRLLKVRRRSLEYGRAQRKDVSSRHWSGLPKAQSSYSGGVVSPATTEPRTVPALAVNAPPKPARYKSFPNGSRVQWTVDSSLPPTLFDGRTRSHETQAKAMTSISTPQNNLLTLPYH